VKAVKDEGERAINKMKEEIAARLEREKIAKVVEQRRKEVSEIFTYIFDFYFTKEQYQKLGNRKTQCNYTSL
jgi:hypothetical protein